MTLDPGRFETPHSELFLTPRRRDSQTPRLLFPFIHLSPLPFRHFPFVPFLLILTSSSAAHNPFGGECQIHFFISLIKIRSCTYTRTVRDVAFLSPFLYTEGLRGMERGPSEKQGVTVTNGKG